MVNHSTAAADPSVAEVARGNSAFAVDLYQRERTKPGNLFFSPYSISTALAMTYTGARGETEREMARVLHFSLAPMELPQAFAGLARRMDEISASKVVSLGIANSIWCQQNYPFTKTFLKLSQDGYGAEARLADFAGNSEAARKEINSWVAQKTQDKIQDLLQAGQLSRDTRLVLCNAVYFKGKWELPFDAKNTRPAPFYTENPLNYRADQPPAEVPMMSQTLSMRSRQFENFSACSLPYTSNVLSMVILLPKAMNGLGALEGDLSAAKLQESLAALDAAPEAKAELFLPKFKLDCRLELTSDLAAMGMPAAFGPQADLSGLTGRRDLYISVVVHQAFVDVNEEGTEAAAATAVGVKMLAVMRNPTPVFRVDHPFMFLIRENQTGSVLFLGRVVQPGK